MKIFCLEASDLVISVQRLQEIKERLAHISPTPWLFVTSIDKDSERPIAEVVIGQNSNLIESPRIAVFEGPHSYYNADFFTHARDDILALLGQVERLLNLFNQVVPVHGGDPGQVS
jgi:hypothetical protein